MTYPNTSTRIMFNEDRMLTFKEYIDDEFVLKLLKDVARYEFNGNTL